MESVYRIPRTVPGRPRRRASPKAGRPYSLLGTNLGTQSLKIVACDARLHVIAEASGAIATSQARLAR